MKINFPRADYLPINGVVQLTVSTNGLAKRNRRVFPLERSENGKHKHYDWAKIGLTTYAIEGKKTKTRLLVDDVKRVFAALPDDFVMPTRTTVERSGGGGSRRGNIANYAALCKEVKRMGAMLEAIMKELGVAVDANAKEESEVAK